MAAPSLTRQTSGHSTSRDKTDASASGQFYLQIVLFAAGNTLSLLVILALYGVWSLLAEFQEPLLWAWLLSVALRDTKVWLVTSLEQQLTTRSLPGLLMRIALFPLIVVKDTVRELNALLAAAVAEERAMQASVSATFSRIYSSSKSRRRSSLTGGDVGYGPVEDVSAAITAPLRSWSFSWLSTTKKTAAAPPPPKLMRSETFRKRLAVAQSKGGFHGWFSSQLVHARYVVIALLRGLNKLISRRRQQPQQAQLQKDPQLDLPMMSTRPVLMRSASVRVTNAQRHTFPDLPSSRMPKTTRLQPSGFNTPQAGSMPFTARPKSRFRNVADNAVYDSGSGADATASHEPPRDSWRRAMWEQVIPEHGSEDEECEVAVPTIAARANQPGALPQNNHDAGAKLTDVPEMLQTEEAGESIHPVLACDDSDGSDADAVPRMRSRRRRGLSEDEDSSDDGVPVNINGPVLSDEDMVATSNPSIRLTREFSTDVNGRQSPTSRLFTWLFRVAVVQQMVLFAMSLDTLSLALWTAAGLAVTSAVVYLDDKLEHWFKKQGERLHTWTQRVLDPTIPDKVLPPTPFAAPTGVTFSSSGGKAPNGVNGEAKLGRKDSMRISDSGSETNPMLGSPTPSFKLKRPESLRLQGEEGADPPTVSICLDANEQNGVNGNHITNNGRSWSIVRPIRRVGRMLLVVAITTARLLVEALQAMDQWIRNVLVKQLNQVVSIGLVIGTLLGVGVLSAVLVVQIGSEGHDAVVHLDQMVRGRAAAAAAAAAKLHQSHLPGLLGLVHDKQRLLAIGLEEVQLKALGAAQSVLPAAIQHGRDFAQSLVQRYNLTPVVSDLEKIAYRLPLSLNCTKVQHQSYSLEVADSQLQLAEATRRLELANQAVQGNASLLEGTMAAWQAQWLSKQQSKRQPATEQTATHDDSSGAVGSEHLNDLHHKLLQASQAMKEATAEQDEAAAAHAEAEETAGLAERKLRACHSLNALDEHDPASKLLARVMQLANLMVHADMLLVQEEISTIYGEATKLFASLTQKGLPQNPISASNTSIAHRSASTVVSQAGHGLYVRLAAWAGWVQRQMAFGNLPGVFKLHLHFTQANDSVVHSDVQLPGVSNASSEASGQGVSGVFHGQIEHAIPDQAKQECQNTNFEVEQQQLIQPADNLDQSDAGVTSDPQLADDVTLETPTDVAISTVTSIATPDNTSSKKEGENLRSNTYGSYAPPLLQLAKGGAGNLIQLGQQLGLTEGLGEVVGQLGGIFGSMFNTLSGSVAAIVGGSTSLAIDAGAALYKTANNIIAFAVSFAVFIGALLYLLSSDDDRGPLQRIICLLPLSPEHQAMADRTLSNAMRAVFVSSLKLAFFHASFTWITLRAMNTHFTTLLTLTSSLFAVLPILPPWSPVILPCIELTLSGGRYTAALLLLATHWLVSGYVDDVILSEIQPSSPYLVGFGVAGGMALWSNPLKGVLLGPMCLALVSAAYNLHSQFLSIEGDLI